MVEGHRARTFAYAAPILLLLLLDSLIDRQLHWRFRRLHAIDLVSRFLAPQPDSSPLRITGSVPGSYRSRPRLVAITAATERYAHRVQHRQDLSVRQPFAYLLRLHAAHLREHLATVESVHGPVPDEIVETVRRTAALLTGGSTTAFMRESEARLAHYSDAVVDTAPRRSWSHWFPGAVDLTDRTARLTVLFVVMGILTWLAVSNQVSLSDIVQWAP